MLSWASYRKRSWLAKIFLCKDLAVLLAPKVNHESGVVWCIKTVHMIFHRRTVRVSRRERVCGLLWSGEKDFISPDSYFCCLDKSAWREFSRKTSMTMIMINAFKMAGSLSFAVNSIFSFYAVSALSKKKSSSKRAGESETAEFLLSNWSL